MTLIKFSKGQDYSEILSHLEMTSFNIVVCMLRLLPNLILQQVSQLLPQRYYFCFLYLRHYLFRRLYYLQVPLRIIRLRLLKLTLRNWWIWLYKLYIYLLAFPCWILLGNFLNGFFRLNLFTVKHFCLSLLISQNQLQILHLVQS